MSTLFRIYLIFNFNYILIECLMPETVPKLSVHKVNKKLIEKKRQETVDMCRIFTEETEKLENIKQMKNNNEIIPKTKKQHRVKRGLQQINPTLKEEDEQRVEKIVDKMYDDLLEQGEKVNYRRISVPTSNENISTGLSGRRFFFAPKLLEGSLSTTQTTTTTYRKNKTSLSGNSNNARFKHGIIPYFIDSKTYDIHLVEVITKAFDYIEKATCIRLQRLRERPTDAASLKEVEWLYITNPTGIRQCVHSNEKSEIKGVQMIIFGYDCMSVGDIAHELMHILGFPHEHVRPDRDQYITVLWDNIKPGYKRFFMVQNTSMAQSFPYDYSSVLHYPTRAFSRNGQATIMTKPGIKIGQRDGLSEMDVEKINSLYTEECMNRNREYLLTTCPSVAKANNFQPVNTTMEDIEAYYAKKVWPYGIINYKLSYSQFSEEERDNINAVIKHIEEETCIEFRNIDDDDPNDSKTDEPESTTDINQISSDKESFKQYENEIITDDAYEKSPEANSIYSSNESAVSVTPDKVSLRAAKKFIRQYIPAQKSSQNTQPVEETNKPLEAAKEPRNKNSRVPLSPSRRHASNILTFTRSPKPGCVCPKTPGAPGSTRTIEINADCFNSVNDLLHLFVHLLGLGHQHNNHDRDSYLHIVWDEVTDDIKEDIKEKLPPAASVGYPYDYQSVMHFPWLQIKNGRTNIMYPIWNDGWAMGHWQGLSHTDVQKLNVLYSKQCALRRNAVEETNYKK